MAGTSPAMTKNNDTCIFSRALRPGSADQSREQIRVDVASGQHDDDVLAADIDATGQKRGEANRAARLDHEFQLTKGKSDRHPDFRIGRGDALREQPAVDGESDFAGDRG